MNGSTATARAFVSALRRGGVVDVVLAPGSRSAALALALHQADSQGLLRLHVRIDERTAAFLALGLTKSSHRPVPVVTTSGTAVVNLHPAVLEALHAGEQLIVVSADRPARMRGTGANQTTEQVGVFGPRVPSADIVPGDADGAGQAVAEAVRRRGPSQLNLQFSEPILPDETASASASRSAADWAAGELGDPLPRRPAGGDEDPTTLRLGPRTVVVAGDGAGPPARLLAERANWPLLAEPTSGSRTGTHALRTARLLLGTGLGSQIERVVVTGHPTLSRPVTALISRADLEVVSVQGPGGVGTDPGRVARHVQAMPLVEGADDEDWLAGWRSADAALSRQVDELADGPGGLCLQVASEVARAVTAEALLVVGSSQPVRDLDVMAHPSPVGERRLVLGNRGLAGIDGTVSTAIGAALGRRSSRSLAYVGDLTFLHDSTGLIVGLDEPRPDLTIVVANDDGGAIFSTLEQGGPEYAGSFERVFGTPHGVSVRAWCEATRTAYERVTDASALRTALAADAVGIRVVEVPLDRFTRRSLNHSLTSLTAPPLNLPRGH